MPENTVAAAERWAAAIAGPAYAIDDATVLTVVNGVVEGIAEGQWHWFTHGCAQTFPLYALE